jgi:acetyl-CoA carboxylase biotin carboxylase subunit
MFPVTPGLSFKNARKTAIVLGSHGVGDLICESLEKLGFLTNFAPSHIQRFASIGWAGSSPDDLRKILRSWVAEQRQKHPESSLWLHPGVSPWAERPELPTLGQELGVQVISPPSRVLSLYGNRLNFLGEAERLSIPNLSLSPNPFHSVREIEKLIKSQRLKLPFVLKAVRGGSGYGIRVIHHPDDLGRALGLWLEQLQRNVGEVILLAEKYVEGARRIVQPFARFANGSTQLFPSMDVSLTCRFRKLIEFCPAVETSDFGSLKKIQEWTEALIYKTGYVGVGSLEFLVDGTRAFLIEGVPRLNTSYHLWEKVAGTSAVSWQLATLHGDPDLAQAFKPEREWTSAVSLRFYAEDPVLQLPQPGKLAEQSEERDWSFPGAQAHFSPAALVGQELMGAEDVDDEKRNPLETQFGGLLGHLWVGGEDRKRALTVAKGILEQLWMAGSLQTNERFLQELLCHPWIQEGIFHASFIDEEFIPAISPSPDMLVLFIAIAQFCASELAPSASFKWVVGDQWMKALSKNPSMEWKSGPHFFEVQGRKGLSGTFMGVNSRSYRTLAYPIMDNKWLVRIGNWSFSVRRVISKSLADGNKGIKPNPKLNALVSGRVHSLLFREGSWVQAHDTVLIIESLGSLIPHALPVDVKVRQWFTKPQELVLSGQVLAELETAVK